MKTDPNKSKYGKKAMELFAQGYNCSQSVLLAFQEVHGLPEDIAAKLSSTFGGGMGRLREVCGAVTGGFMVIGLLAGYDDPKAFEEKKETYEKVQEFARRMEEENGSIICRELLGLTEKKQAPTPEKRTDAYYKKRPCKELVGVAAAQLELYLKELELI
ncbi:MAG: C-GCAxxG-C-C family protein [Lachnospiraceae bacterium]|nr:C-GCAxxG-C-C family protein [Lachnospiraceae bacterium]